MLPPAVVREAMVAELTGLDLTRAAADYGEQLEALLARYPVLVIRDQDLSDAELEAFALRLGPLTPMGQYNENSRMGQGAVFDVSNLAPDHRMIAEEGGRRVQIETARLWHVDSSYNAIPDAYSILYAKRVSARGGETEFADQRAAYEALPEMIRQRLAGLFVVHARGTLPRRAGFDIPFELPPGTPREACHAIVRVNPLSGWPALYTGLHMIGIRGMADAEFEALLDELITFSTQPRFVYSHRWRPGDLVLWDNRAAMHRGRPYDMTREVRDLRQVRVKERDYRPFEA